MFAFFKIFPYLIPFLKEMILGKKTWAEGFRDNKKKTVFAIFVIISFALNFLTVPKLAVLATKYITLNREYADYRSTHPTLAPSTQKHPMANGAEVTAEIKPPQVVKTNSHDSKPTSAEEIEAEFNRIRERESTER